MRKATKTAAMWLGIVAGIAGLEHGYFEMLQANAPWTGMVFPSMGPPCSPDVAWNACEPAMSLLPNFWMTGLLAVLLGLVMIAWSAAFLQTRRGGLVLILLSVALLLLGGGFFPPLIGIIGGAAGLQINKPITARPGGFTRFAARLWPWPLLILMVWLLGQFPVGYFFNDFLQGIMGFGLLLILTMLPLSAYSAYAYDAVQGFRNQKQVDTRIAVNHSWNMENEMVYRSILVTRRGGPEVIEIVEKDLRPTAAGEVRVKILASPVCQDDVAVRVGNRPFLAKTPFTPGYSILGIVDSVGENVTGVKKEAVWQR